MQGKFIWSNIHCRGNSYIRARKTRKKEKECSCRNKTTSRRRI